MREIYIRKTERIEVAVVEDGRLVEYIPEDGDSSTEAIYLGKVERVVPGMKAAFVDIGQEKNGFLPIEERNAENMPRLQSGMNILVQVRKEAQGVKGAFLSRDISLCGEFVLLNPMNTQVNVSSRITTESTRKRLKSIGKAIADSRFGLVMRTAAADASEEAILAEANALYERWESIKRAAPTVHAPSVIHALRTAVDTVLDDYRPRGIDRICTNDSALAEQLQAVAPVTLMSDSIFDVARITSQIRNALERRVWLESGGNLVFDACEAMTVVDVNTAKFTGSRDLNDTVRTLNLEACGEIACQVRLRNISGIIIIDMIDMVSKADHKAVLDELERCFAADRVKTVVHGFTSLGLVEMTRKRSRPPLKEVYRKESHNG